jgi:hypothetical protein
MHLEGQRGFGRGGPARRRGALPAGRAVRRSARMAGASPSGRAAASCSTVDRRRRPAHEQPQSPIVGTLLGACAECARVHCAEHGPTHTINDGDDDLRVARRVEHDPGQPGAAVRQRHQLTCADRLHLRKRTWDVAARHTGQWSRADSNSRPPGCDASQRSRVTPLRGSVRPGAWIPGWSTAASGSPFGTRVSVVCTWRACPAFPA